MRVSSFSLLLLSQLLLSVTAQRGAPISSFPIHQLSSDKAIQPQALSNPSADREMESASSASPDMSHTSPLEGDAPDVVARRERSIGAGAKPPHMPRTRTPRTKMSKPPRTPRTKMSKPPRTPHTNMSKPPRTPRTKPTRPPRTPRTKMSKPPRTPRTKPTRPPRTPRSRTPHSKHPKAATTTTATPAMGKPQSVFSAVANAALAPPPENVESSMSLNAAKKMAKVQAAANPTPPRFHVAATVPFLSYYGGPVISSVKVVPLFWNSKVLNQAALTTFYSDITKSPFMDSMAEYGVGRGTSVAGINLAQSATSVTDAVLRSLLLKWAQQGTIPAPTASTYYAIHMPPGMGYRSSQNTVGCVDICAIHDTYQATLNGQQVSFYYAVMMDVSAASLSCYRGCGPTFNVLQNAFYIASHELAEVVTDPAIGLTTTVKYPVAWYSVVRGGMGENADVCDGTPNIVAVKNTKYTVAKLWSNRMNACV